VLEALRVQNGNDIPEFAAVKGPVVTKAAFCRIIDSAASFSFIACCLLAALLLFFAIKRPPTKQFPPSVCIVYD
jgi:hypothetical protein